MQTVDFHEAKTSLSKLIDAVELGEEIVIVKAGKAAARLVPITQSPVARKPGALKGKIFISEDFDAPLPDNIQAAFKKR